MVVYKDERFWDFCVFPENGYRQHKCQKKTVDVNKVKDTGNSEWTQSILWEE